MKAFCNGDCLQGRYCNCAVYKASWWTLFFILVCMVLLVVGLRLSPELVEWLVN